MKVTEFRKLIREEVRKVLKESGPLDSLMGKFNSKLQDLSREIKILDAWKQIPKKSFGSSYERLSGGNQKEFERILRAAMANPTPTANSILDLCEFILRNAQIFEPGVVTLISKILKM